MLPKPPVATRRPRHITQHGQTRTDDYFWLRDGDKAEIIAYLEAENAYTSAVLQPAGDLEKKLYEELLSRIKQTDLSVPVRIDDYYYYSRTEQGLQYPIQCRKKDSLEAGEQVLLDLNELGANQPYLRLANYKPSPDHKLLAYSFDTSGDEVYITAVKDLDTGSLLADRLPNTYYGLEWTNDGRSFLYVTLDEAKRPYQVCRHTLGSSPESDQMLYEEPDERFHLTLCKSRSKRFFFVQLKSASTSEILYAEAGADPALRVFTLRRDGIEYDVEHHGNWFYVRTTDGGRGFRVLRAPVDSPAPENWREWIPHRADTTIESVEAFRDHIVLLERGNGLRKLRVYALGGGEHTVETPETVYTLFPAQNPEFETNLIRFQYTSLVTPMSVFDYNMDTRERTLLKQTEVLGGYDPARYETIRAHATAPDGVKVPLSLVYRKGIERDGSAALLLYGYGSYGISSDPVFSSDRLSLLDRGFVYAIAHIRGGSDLGKTWHDAGKLLHKRNTFLDFIACAEYLIKEKYTSPRRLAILGGSAGGLLVGAVLNMRPDLFGAAVAKVPFVDVLNTATDPTLPLTVIEYDEWGNSNEKQFWEYIKSYSPYDNVASQPYPHILATAGLNDPRVSYWEPAKWIAKLRALNTSANLLLLKTNLSAGHGGASGRYDKLKETAFEFAFLLYMMDAVAKLPD
jgi:oligopeptidase B